MDFAQQVKAQIDIVDVVRQYVPLKRIGSTQSHLGLCPFHNEKTPSFRVHSDHQFYKCFGCGKGGDVFRFVQEIENMSFYEALRLLAERYGIPMPRRAEFADEATKQRASLHQMHEEAAAVFHSGLETAEGRLAMAYLERRGVRREEIETFALGYSDRQGHTLTRRFEKQYPPDVLESSGLVSRRQDGTGYYDRFRHRLMFPIHSESGKVIGFGGRTLGDDEPKYLNSAETPIYRKSYVLYNLHRAKDAIRKSGFSVLVEGYMDVIGVWAAGVQQVVATCGTSLTTQQVQALKRHSTHIVVNFDPDTAGANAAERSIQVLLDEGMHVRILELEGGLDPDEYCREQGADAYQNALSRATGYFQWLANRARTRFDMKTSEGRSEGLQFLLPSIHRVTDKMERVALADEVASYLGIEKGLVLESFRRAAGDRKETRLRPVAEAVPFSERALLHLLLTDASARELLVPRLRSLDLVDEFATRRAFHVLFALHESAAPVTFSEIDARLEGADKERFATVVLADDTGTEVFSLEQGEACVHALEMRAQRIFASDLKRRIREAERSGNLQQAMQLMEDLNRLQSSRPGVQLTAEQS